MQGIFESDVQFYPTPPGTVHEMIRDLKLSGKSVLDPMAGDGAILDEIQSRHSSHYSRVETYAIEIDASLQAILREKGHQVIDADFFQYHGKQYFDAIIMNPAFNSAVEALLKAWDISNGAVIKCLLNADTVGNPYTQDRKRLLHLIEKHGDVQDLGRPFASARRPTNVEIVLVTLQDTTYTPAYEFKFDGARTTTGKFEEEAFSSGEIAPSDLFESYEAQHRAGLDAFGELLKAKQKVEHYFETILPDLRDPIKEALAKDGPRNMYNTFQRLSTRYAWDGIFSKTKLWSVTTESVRRQIEAEQTTQGQMAFTAQNMHDLFYKLVGSRQQIMLACTLEVFDDLTSYYKENREYVEGWKTNNAYFIGKRFILPSIGSDRYSGLDYYAKGRIGDIEKALCFLSGQRLENISAVTQMYENDSYYGQWITSTFFDTKLFKKHTMHFRWRDEDLRQRFNAVVAQHRWNFLPEKIKKGFYE